MTASQRAAYRERVIAQTRRWVAGRSVHNHVDNECCPDFACCRPELFTKDKGEREQYLFQLLHRYNGAERND